MNGPTSEQAAAARTRKCSAWVLANALTNAVGSELAEATADEILDRRMLADRDARLRSEVSA